MAVRIGDLLLKEKRITPEQLQEALNYQRQHGGKLGFNLVKLGYVKDEEITALLSKQYGVPSIALSQFEIDPTVIKLVPAETAQKYHVTRQEELRRLMRQRYPAAVVVAEGQWRRFRPLLEQGYQRALDVHGIEIFLRRSETNGS